MKHNPLFDETRERMAPGQLGRDGFLGDDTRPIPDIIAADVAVLEHAGIRAEQLAEILDELHAAADAAQETPVDLYNGRVTAQITEVMGRIPCPFACGHRAHKACIRVQFNGQEVLLTPLHAHLIREHSFFQGHGAPFRVAPSILIDLYRTAREPSSTFRVTATP